MNYDDSTTESEVHASVLANSDGDSLPASPMTLRSGTKIGADQQKIGCNECGGDDSSFSGWGSDSTEEASQCEEPVKEKSCDECDSSGSLVPMHEHCQDDKMHHKSRGDERSCSSSTSDDDSLSEMTEEEQEEKKPAMQTEEEPKTETDEEPAVQTEEEPEMETEEETQTTTQEPDNALFVFETNNKLQIPTGGTLEWLKQCTRQESTKKSNDFFKSTGAPENTIEPGEPGESASLAMQDLANGYVNVATAIYRRLPAMETRAIRQLDSAVAVLADYISRNETDISEQGLREARESLSEHVQDSIEEARNDFREAMRVVQPGTEDYYPNFGAKTSDALNTRELLPVVEKLYNGNTETATADWTKYLQLQQEIRDQLESSGESADFFSARAAFVEHSFAMGLRMDSYSATYVRNRVQLDDSGLYETALDGGEGFYGPDPGDDDAFDPEPLRVALAQWISAHESSTSEQRRGVSQALMARVVQQLAGNDSDVNADDIHALATLVSQLVLVEAKSLAASGQERFYPLLQRMATGIRELVENGAARTLSVSDRKSLLARIARVAGMFDQQYLASGDEIAGARPNENSVEATQLLRALNQAIKANPANKSAVGKFVFIERQAADYLDANEGDGERTLPDPETLYDVLYGMLKGVKVALGLVDATEKQLIMDEWKDVADEIQSQAQKIAGRARPAPEPKPAEENPPQKEVPKSEKQAETQTQPAQQQPAPETPEPQAEPTEDDDAMDVEPAQKRAPEATVKKIASTRTRRFAAYTSDDDEDEEETAGKLVIGTTKK